MNYPPIKAALYKGSSVPIQNSFKYKSNVNLNATGTAETSAPIDSETVFVTTSVYIHIGFGHPATLADMVVPPGMWAFVIERGSTISVLKSGVPDGVASIITPEL